MSDIVAENGIRTALIDVAVRKEREKHAAEIAALQARLDAAEGHAAGVAAAAAGGFADAASSGNARAKYVSDLSSAWQH